MANLEMFRGLQEIDLSRNVLIDVTKVKFGTLQRLKKLDLSRNLLETLPSDITNCPSLEQLLIHRNKLSSLPEGMGNMRSLIILDASFNLIVSVGDELEELFNLQELNLTNNDRLFTEDMGTRTRRLFDKVCKDYLSVYMTT